MVPQYTTIAGPVATEIEINRSRFLTRLERVTSESAAREVIAEVRAEHPRARHHCTAFVIGPDARLARSNDDGEPSGTAGVPMLETLQAAGVSDVVAVVTRYFGGVLLGAGGLTRAYRTAVASALESAQLIVREEQQCFRVLCTYEHAGGITQEARRLGITIGHAEYTDVVLQELWAPADREQQLREIVASFSAGTGEVTLGERAYVDLV